MKWLYYHGIAIYPPQTPPHHGGALTLRYEELGDLPHADHRLHLHRHLGLVQGQNVVQRHRDTVTEILGNTVDIGR